MNMILSRQKAIEAFNKENAVEETQSISCLICGQLWNILKESAEEDDFLNCCPSCTPEAWDADSEFDERISTDEIQ